MHSDGRQLPGSAPSVRSPHGTQPGPPLRSAWPSTMFGPRRPARSTMPSLYVAGSGPGGAALLPMALNSPTRFPQDPLNQRHVGTVFAFDVEDLRELELARVVSTDLLSEVHSGGHAPSEPAGRRTLRRGRRPNSPATCDSGGLGLAVWSARGAIGNRAAIASAKRNRLHVIEHPVGPAAEVSERRDLRCPEESVIPALLASHPLAVELLIVLDAQGAVVGLLLDAVRARA
jgi:hypothetical protein